MHGLYVKIVIRYAKSKFNNFLFSFVLVSVFTEHQFSPLCVVWETLLQITEITSSFKIDKLCIESTSFVCFL
jgi:hypothetical protein